MQCATANIECENNAMNECNTCHPVKLRMPEKCQHDTQAARPLLDPPDPDLRCPRRPYTAPTPPSTPCRSRKNNNNASYTVQLIAELAAFLEILRLLPAKKPPRPRSAYMRRTAERTVVCVDELTCMRVLTTSAGQVRRVARMAAKAPVLLVCVIL